MKKVSVIIPVYNVERYLRRCIDSILVQTYRNFEVICINDCSSDESENILEEYNNNYLDIVKVLSNQENLGLGKTRERGIAIAEGEYIMFVDSDDFVDKNWIERYVLEMESQESLDMIIGGFSITSENKVVPQVVPDNRFSIFMYPSACTRIYRKKFLDENEINFGGLRRSEDNFWSIMIALSHPNYKIISDVGYHYWINAESITRSIKRKDNCVEKELDLLHSTIFKKLNFSKMTVFEKQMIEYLFVSNTFLWLFFYNRGCGIKCMKKKYDYSIRNLEKYFCDFKKNPLLRFGKMKVGSFLSRNFVSLETFLCKIKLGKILFYLRALL